MILTDNTTAVSCIRRQGTLRSDPLIQLTKKILEFCFDHKITLSAQTPPRPAKCPSGLKVSSDTHRHRMVFRSDNLQYPLAQLWPFLYRPFRQQRKQQAEGLHFSIPRPFVFRGERPFPPLGRMGLPVHFSTSSLDGGSASTSSDVPGQGRAHSPILCSIKVVPSTSEQMPNTLPSPRRLFTVPEDMSGNSIPQPPRVVQASRLVTLRLALKDKGLSEYTDNLTFRDIVWIL